MRWIVLLVILIVLIWFVQHYVFAPHYTEPARRQFILETLRNADFEKLSGSSIEKSSYPFRGRTLGAKRITYPRPDVGPQAITLEFDVQPTVRTYGSISRSEFILVRSPDHLQEIKDKLKHADSYEDYCIYPKEWGPPRKF